MRIGSALALLGALCACAHDAPRTDGIPGAWNAFGGGVWQARRGDDGAEQLHVDASGVSGEGFNLLLSGASQGPDLEVSTRLLAEGGVEDQGGGVVWRARDADNYYVARWNPLEDNLRLYKVERGARKLLVTLDADLDAAAWHELRASMKGERIVVVLDSKYVISFDDATFTAAGKVGLWTKADASTLFTAPVVKAAPE